MPRHFQRIAERRCGLIGGLGQGLLPDTALVGLPALGYGVTDAACPRVWHRPIRGPFIGVCRRHSALSSRRSRERCRNQSRRHRAFSYGAHWRRRDVPAGDAAYSKSKRDHRRRPSIHADKDKPLPAMRLGRRRTKARPWINHDRAQRDTLKMGPAYQNRGFPDRAVPARQAM